MLIFKEGKTLLFFSPVGEPYNKLYLLQKSKALSKVRSRVLHKASDGEAPVLEIWSGEDPFNDITSMSTQTRKDSTC